MRQRPGRMMRSASIGGFSRLLTIASVISAATLMPMLATRHEPVGQAEARHGLRHPRLGQMAGQEEELFSHVSRSSTARSSSGSVSTTVVASKVLSFSVFSRSMRRG